MMKRLTRDEARRAREMLIDAAQGNGDIEAATKAVERAAFMQFIWMPGTAPRSKSCRRLEAGSKATRRRSKR
jgi:hypothetical protein